MSTPFYITTAISYVNGKPHLGHAYEALATDVIARFKRLDGYDVRFMTGTDEHGEKVQRSAEEAGVTSMEFATENANAFRAMCDDLNVAYDDFIRTTEPRHKEAVTELWKKMDAAGDIYLGGYSGWYSVRDEAFLKESELVKQPDGSFLTDEGKPVEWVEEPSYFFKLSAYQDKLLELYEQHPDFILPASRRNEVISFVQGGLEDLSISRTSFDWGIPVPGDEKHIMYVWLDALTNYISSLGYLSNKEGLYEKFWPADIHVIGKDILRFHAVYWPAFLMSAGLELPKRIYAHGFLNLKGQKMSKSLGNVLTPKALADEFGRDQLRFFLMREVRFGSDGAFDRESMINRINADLANGLGNLAQRTLSMIHKNCDAKIPAPWNPAWENIEDAGVYEAGIYVQTEASLDNARRAMDEQAIHEAVEQIWYSITFCDQYIAKREPWTLRKSDPDEMAAVLGAVAEGLRRIAILAQPFIPEASAKLLDMLGVPEAERLFEHVSADYALKVGTPIEKPLGLFPRLELEPEEAAQ